MDSSTIAIKPYSAGLLDPFSRLFIFLGCLIFGAWFIKDAISEIPNLMLCLAACFCAVIFICVVTFVIFTYVELDDQHIAYVFHIGSFCRIEHSSVRWADVRTADIYRSTKPRMTDLELTTRDNRKFRFSVSQYSDGERRFETIVHHFSKLTNHS